MMNFHAVILNIASDERFLDFCLTVRSAFVRCLHFLPSPSLTMAASNEFTVHFTRTSSSGSLQPFVEWYCLQDEFCTYSNPSMASRAPATFTDFSQYRGNLAGLGSKNEVTLQDGSSLYGSTCDNCEAVLYYNSAGTGNQYVRCPIGSEMVMTATGTANEQQFYNFAPFPRVTLVGEMPSTCLFVDGLYRCESGSVSLRFTSVEQPCDTLADGPCEFPSVGRTFGVCSAADPCPLELN